MSCGISQDQPRASIAHESGRLSRSVAHRGMAMANKHDAKWTENIREMRRAETRPRYRRSKAGWVKLL